MKWISPIINLIAMPILFCVVFGYLPDLGWKELPKIWLSLVLLSYIVDKFRIAADKED